MDYEGFEAKDFIKWIDACHKLFDELDVQREDDFDELSVYGRLLEYANKNKSQLAALTTRLLQAEAIIKPIAEHAEIINQQMNNQVMEVAHFFSVEEYARAAAWLKGGTE